MKYREPEDGRREIAVRNIVIALAVALAVLGMSCGSGGNDRGHAGSGGHMDGASEPGSVPGTAANPADATREIVIRASDDLRFAPASIDIHSGEVVTFVVRNVGKNKHELVLGDDFYQDQHETKMKGGQEHMGRLANAVDVAPGDTAKLTWRFSGSGQASVWVSRAGALRGRDGRDDHDRLVGVATGYRRAGDDGPRWSGDSVGTVFRCDGRGGRRRRARVQRRVDVGWDIASHIER